MATKRQRPFRSFADINKYNELLIELDKQQRETNLKNQIKEEKQKFAKYKKSTLRIEIEDDPNIYEEIKSLKLTKESVHISTSVRNISDLIELTTKYSNNPKYEYNIDIHALHRIKNDLIELNNMIGMKTLKENIVDQILFFLQKLHLEGSNDFMHTVIYGSPGTGKTEVARIIGNIFAKLGILKKNIFKKVTRSDLVSGYLGQTAAKTLNVIHESLGGVLFIDEAYALGNEEKRDSFSKECIDTLCEALSFYKNDLMVIIAGYETELNTCFFGYNQGLQSRFTWRFKTDDYTGEDLYKIFVKKVNDGGWLIQDTNINVGWFEKNKDKFVFYGRDIETLFSKTKIAHSKRIFGQDIECKKKLVMTDLEQGLDTYLKNTQKTTLDKDRFNQILTSMYV
jgi:SpoVK/Ycf46/Vps4 family AAA+-type ATPase